MAIEKNDKNLHLSPILDQIRDNGPSDGAIPLEPEVAKTDSDSPVPDAAVPENNTPDIAAKAVPLERHPEPGPVAPVASSRGLPRVLLLAFLAALVIVGALRWDDLQPVRSAASHWLQQFMPESTADLQGVQVRLMEVELRLRQLETDLSMLRPQISPQDVMAEPAPELAELSELSVANAGAEEESVEPSAQAQQLAVALPEQSEAVAKELQVVPLQVEPQEPLAEEALPQQNTKLDEDKLEAPEVPAESKAWSVVLISLVSREQAERWVENFDYQAYPLDIVEIQLRNKTYYRVRVGNLAGRSQAVEIMNQMKRESGRKDAWVSYD